MCRVLEFHEYRARWWEDRRNHSGKSIINPGLADGISAYAEGRAQLHRDLAMWFRGMWANFRGGATSVLSEDETDEIQQPEIEADGDQELSDEEEDKEGVAIEEDWEFITEDTVG